MMERLECEVYGRVQMVMFRDFTTRNARKLGLVGYVKNMKDGTVKIVAEAEEKQLLKLVEKLKKGSILSRVDLVDEKWLKSTNKFTDFNIKYDE